METDGLIFAATRALHIGCALLLVSLPLFATFIWRPAAEERGQHEVFCRNVLVLLGGLLLVEWLTGAAWLWYVSASMTDEPSGRPSAADLGLVLTQTHFGVLWIVRAAVALMLGSLLTALAVGGPAPRRSFRIALWLALALGMTLLGSLAFAGHAASGLRWPVWHLIVDMVHLLSGAVWPMGLIPLAMFLRSGRSCEPVVHAASTLVVRRYSGCAFAAVLALVASGVANSWLTLPSWTALFNSTYGWLLITKVLIVLVMIGLGALNRYRFLPAFANGAGRTLARTVALETGLAVIVVLIVGVMGMTAPGP